MRKAILIGYGRWGKILEPYIKQFFDLVDVCGRNYEITPDIDVVFVATPIDNHYPIVKHALLLGKHVFCEKPLTTHYYECVELKHISDRNNVKLYTDYTERVAPSRKFMEKNIHKIGNISYISSYFLKNFKNKYPIPWHLHCHMLSILSLFVDITKLNFTLSNDTILFEKKNFLGQITCSANSQDNKKFFEIIGDGGKISYDFYNKNTVCLENYKDNKIEYFSFNEQDNLHFSVKEFYEMIEKNIDTNIRISCIITNIIEQLLDNRNKYY